MPRTSSIVRRLDALTPEQEAQLPFFRDKWMALGLSTERADRGRAEAGIRLAYQRAGKEPPAIIVWLGSPMAGAIGAAFLKELLQKRAPKNGARWAQVRDQVWDQVEAQVRDQVRDQVWDQVEAQVGDQVGDQVWAQVGAQVRAQVRDQVWDQVWDQVEAQVRDQVWAQVGDQVGDQVWAQVEAQVRDQVRDQVGDQVGAQVWDAGYGQHDASWIGFYDVFRAFGLSDLTDKLDGLAMLTDSCGWYWPFEGLCVLTERQSELRRDAQGRLHAENAAALKYPDGWAIYAWHGVRVAEAIILRPDTIPVKQIQDERNAEVRRVMLERYGFGRFIADTGAIPIHADETGTLYRMELDGDEPLCMVSVLNSTAEPDGEFKQYQLRVPPTITTAREAVAWTFGQTAKTYRPAQET